MKEITIVEAMVDELSAECHKKLRDQTLHHLKKEEKSILRYMRELDYDLKVVQAQLESLRED